jgi:hypothetical protein
VIAAMYGLLEIKLPSKDARTQLMDGISIVCKHHEDCWWGAWVRLSVLYSALGGHAILVGLATTACFALGVQ